MHGTDFGLLIGLTVIWMHVTGFGLIIYKRSHLVVVFGVERLVNHL